MNSRPPSTRRGPWRERNAGRVGTYNNGELFRPPRGRYAPRAPIIDVAAQSHAVVDLDREPVDAATFVRRIDRELKIRFYQVKSRKSYAHVLRSFLRFLGAAPRSATRESVREWLELLVDGGASSSTVSVHLSCLRTVFDKMCFREITLGLVTPRRAHTLPVVLAVDEVKRLLRAAPALRDKLLLGWPQFEPVGGEPSRHNRPQQDPPKPGHAHALTRGSEPRAPRTSSRRDP